MTGLLILVFMIVFINSDYEDQYCIDANINIEDNLALSNRSGSLDGDNIIEDVEEVDDEPFSISRETGSSEKERVPKTTLDKPCWRVILPDGKGAEGSKVYLIKISDEIRKDYLESDDNFNYPFEIKETFTDSDGMFYYEDLPFDQYLVHVELGGYASAHCNLDLRSGFPEELTLKLKIGRRIKGKVIDIKGDPIPDVPVEVSLPYLPADNLYSMPPADAIDLVFFHELQKTDSHGIFNIPDQNKKALYFTIEEGSVDGYCGVLRGIPRYSNTDILIVLKKKCTLRGTIKDEMGSPVSDAVLWDISFDDGKKTFGNQCAVSDEKGKYIFNSTREGELYIQITHDTKGNASTFVEAVAGKDNVQDFILPEAVTKKIIVLNSQGHTINGIYVFIQDLDTGVILQRGKTDRNGIFSSQSLVKGNTIYLSANEFRVNQDYNYVSKTFKVEDDSDQIITLVSYNKITVNVFDKETGKRIEAFNGNMSNSSTVLAESYSYNNIEYNKYSEGKMTGNFVYNAALKLVILADGYLPYQKVIDVSGVDDEECSIDVYLEKMGGQVAGIVRDAVSKELILDANVKLLLNGMLSNKAIIPMGSKYSTTTDLNGMFCFDKIPDTEYAVSIECYGFANKTVKSELLIQTNNPSKNIIEIYKAGSISGYLYKDKKTPMASGIIKLLDEDGLLLKKVCTSSNGYYIVGGLSGGKYKLSASDYISNTLYGSFANNVKEIYVKKGENIKVDFEFSGCSIITGKCVINDKGLNHIPITLRDNKNELIMEHITMDDGIFKIMPVKEGDYTISAECPLEGSGGVVTKNIHVGKDEEVFVELVMSGIGFRGHVRNYDGKAIYGCKVLLEKVEGAGTCSALSGGEGNFKFFSLVPGMYDVSVVAPGYASVKDQVMINETGELERDYTLKAESILKIKIHSDGGGNVSNPVAKILDRDGFNGEVISDGRGLFVFKNMEAGKVTILAGGKDHAPSCITAGLVSGETIEKDLTLSQGAHLRVEAKNQEGAPIAGAKIGLNGPGFFGVSWKYMVNNGFIQAEPEGFVTSINGIFETGPLPEATYTIELKHGALYWSGKKSLSRGEAATINASM